jgi:ferredoxin
MLFEGRLDRAMLASACPDLAERVVFCCGPDGFRRQARQIHEGWSPQAEHPFLEESFGGEAIELPEIGEWRIDFATSRVTAEGSGTVTLLDVARQRGVSIQADCEAGICGTCRCRVSKGAWRVAANSADPERSVLSPEEQAQGFVLACSTSPIGSVEVEL